MKKKISKIMGILLAAVLCIGGLASCGAKGQKNIAVITREDGSGTKGAFMEILGLKGKADVTGALVIPGTDAVLAEVKGNPNAIAFESLGYVTDEVKKLKVDGVEATVENIKNGTYKIARPLSVVYKAETLEKDALAKEFLTFLQSEEAQKIIRDNGYVSTQDNAAPYSAKPGLTGKLDISGSTSLQPLMLILKNEFAKFYGSDVTVNVSGGGSGTGYKNAEGDVSTFGMISETFKTEKAPSCTSYEVAKDGIAIIVSKQNSVSDISLDTLKNIYNSEAGEDAVTTWDKVN